MAEAGKPEGLSGGQAEQPSNEIINLPEQKGKPLVNPVRVMAQSGLRVVDLCVLVSPWEQGPMRIYPRQEKPTRMFGC
jgi:hypothetical protein